MATVVAPPSVPKLWPDSTVVCIGGGPSVTPDDVEACRGQHVIAIKEAIRLAPFAEVLYSSDARWFQWAYADLPPAGAHLAYCLESQGARWSTVLQHTGPTGLEVHPTALRTGRNSGYAAINLAVHLGAKRIVLLGYDFQPGPAGQRNWFSDRPSGYWRAAPPYDISIMQCWPTIVDPLQAAGVEVVNATRQTALDVFPRVALEQAFA